MNSEPSTTATTEVLRPRLLGKTRTEALPSGKPFGARAQFLYKDGKSRRARFGIAFPWRLIKALSGGLHV